MRVPPQSARQRVARWLALIVAGVLPLVVWPGLTQPFSTPKRWLLAGTSLTVALLAWGVDQSERRKPLRLAAVLRALPFVWLASWASSALFAESVSLEALVTAIGGGVWGLALLASRPRPRDLALTLAASGAAVSLIALGQWFGWDLFRAFGWQPGIEGASVRMRVYATFGNPNFVGGFLAAVAPMTASVAMDERAALRIAAWIALLCECLAIAATGSRGALLGLVSAALIWTLIAAGTRFVAVTAIALAVAGVFVSAGRPLADTRQGRLYVWRVIAAHGWTHPLAGFGPGTTEARFMDWEQERLPLERPDDVARFGGVPQHADNDYLEALVERGVPGLVAVLLSCAVPIAAAFQGRMVARGSRLLAGAAGTVAAIAAVALVDEPLSRASELMLLWTAIPLIHMVLADDVR